MPNSVVAKVQLAAGGATHGGTRGSFLIVDGEAQGVLSLFSPIFMGSWLFTNGDVSKQGHTHLGPFKGVHGACGLSAAPQRMSVTAGLWGCCQEARRGCRGALCWTRPAALGSRLRGYLGPPGLSLRRIAAAEGTAGACGSEPPPGPPGGGGGSKGLNCQRRDVKQVSKAPHISAD